MLLNTTLFEELLQKISAPDRVIYMLKVFIFPEPLL